MRDPPARKNVTRRSTTGGEARIRSVLLRITRGSDRLVDAPARRGLVSALTRAGLERPLPVLLVAAAVVAVSIRLASGLEIRSSFQELLPEDVPSVQEIKKLIERVGGDGTASAVRDGVQTIVAVGGDGTVLVVIESLEGPSGLQKAEALAPVLTREFLGMGREQIRSVQSSMAPIRACSHRRSNRPTATPMHLTR